MSTSSRVKHTVRRNARESRKAKGRRQQAAAWQSYWAGWWRVQRQRFLSSGKRLATIDARGRG
jgi:hypothetical protein